MRDFSPKRKANLKNNVPGGKTWPVERKNEKANNEEATCFHSFHFNNVYDLQWIHKRSEKNKQSEMEMEELMEEAKKSRECDGRESRTEVYESLDDPLNLLN